MTALRKILIEEEFVANNVVRAPVTKLYVVANNAPVETPEETAGSTLKNIALFLAAPFIGLAYIVALPFVGLAVMAVLAGRVAAKFNAVKTVGLVLKNVGLAVATPVLGLAFVAFFPIIGFVTLVWMAGTAAAAEI